MPFTRTEILKRLGDTISAKQPILGAGSSAGLIAKCAQAGGADLIVVHSTGKSRLMGLPTTRLGDANRVTVEMVDEILNVVRETPVVGGIDATDPTRWDLRKIVKTYREAGFDGIINLPTISIFDDWRKRGDQVGLVLPVKSADPDRARRGRFHDVVRVDAGRRRTDGKGRGGLRRDPLRSDDRRYGRVSKRTHAGATYRADDRGHAGGFVRTPRHDLPGSRRLRSDTGRHGAALPRHTLPRLCRRVQYRAHPVQEFKSIPMRNESGER